MLDLLIGLVVLGLLIFRQLQSRPVRGNQRLLLILLVAGLVEMSSGLQRVHVGPATVAALAGSLVLAAIFGALRAFTVRIWMQDGQPWVQGGLLTAALWVVALVAHLGYDFLVGQDKTMAQLGTATLLLYLVVSLGVQRLVVAYRVQRLSPAGLGVPVTGRSSLVDVVHRRELRRRGNSGRQFRAAANGRLPRSVRIDLYQAARRTGAASMPTTLRRGHGDMTTLADRWE